MVRQQYMYGDPSSNIWRQAVDAVKQVLLAGSDMSVACSPAPISIVDLEA
jgi:hypothetical protein